MKNVWTIAQRDLKSYFTSPIAYFVIGVFLFVIGMMFFSILSHFAREAVRYSQYGRSISLTDGVIAPLFGNINAILMFLTPFITMRLFAEERKNSTIQLLLTSPVTLTEIILGKFFSAFLLVCVMLAGTLVYPIVLLITGNPDVGTIFSAYLGTLLLSGAILSVGTLFSAVTENQIVAGALTFGAILFFWIINWVSVATQSSTGEVLNYLSIIQHFMSLNRGLVQTSDLIFYGSFIGMGLYLTHTVLDAFRWR